MIAVPRHYLIGEEQNGAWDLVSNMPRDPSLRRVALIALVANGCPRTHMSAALGVSEPTLNRDFRVLKRAYPNFGSPAWRLRYLEDEAEQIRRSLGRDDEEAMGN